jgi:TRAP-type transport system periplasmic protein
MMQRRDMMRAAAVTLAVPFIGDAAAQAPTRWDLPVAWGPTEFHTINAGRFATAVREATNGSVQITIHPGGSLGVRANETLRAVSDGVVPIGEFAAFQNVGELPLLGIESIPFLIGSYDELATMHSVVRPVWERELERRNQMVLYVVPWPMQCFYFKRPINSAADMRGIRMRTYDRVTAEMVTRIGMVAQQLNNPDIVPALASGRVDAVMTSGTTAVAQRYWEFLKHCYVTNHLWASNMCVVNLEAWRRLPEATRTAIQEIGKRMEPDFWNVSKGEHDIRMNELRQHGMTSPAPRPPPGRSSSSTASASAAREPFNRWR